ncbi:hypothetical protein A0256_01065 [Mucilaginibacter sp. PAMC 26640]|nr:hypothetical protein A0256_01065 [Mucilaginibacter sp. PAMC 26640]
MNTNNLFDGNEQVKIDSDEKLDTYIQAHHKRFHNILFWAGILIVLNFAMLINKILNLYTGTASTEMLYFKMGLGLMIVAFVLFLVFLWKADSEIGPPEWSRIKILIHYQIGIINKEVGLILAYLVAYSLVLLYGYIFYTSTKVISTKKITEIVTPGTMLVYGIGIYFLYHGYSRRSKLKSGIKQLENESDQQFL